MGSISSNTKMVPGRVFKIANNKAMATSARSPPESSDKLCNFLPVVGYNFNTVSNKFAGSTNTKSARPPPNNSRKAV